MSPPKSIQDARLREYTPAHRDAAACYNVSMSENICKPDGRCEPDAPRGSVWFARFAVFGVFLLNVTCAVQFIVWPEAYAPAYGLPPTPESRAMVAGLGVAFLMWNATYPAVIANPVRFRALYVVVLVQQAIGLAGESWIWLRLSTQGLAASQMAGGIMRFIAFDGGGLILMLVAFAVLARTAR